MKPALFNVLCEIKEKTGRNETPAFGCFSLARQTLEPLALLLFWGLHIVERECEHERHFCSLQREASRPTGFKQYVFFKSGSNCF